MRTTTTIMSIMQATTAQSVRLRCRREVSASLPAPAFFGPGLAISSGDCMVARAVCQALLAVAASIVAANAGAAEWDAERTRQAVKMVERLERTCVEYSGPNTHKLLNAMVLEAVRLYETAKYDPAIDSILLASAMYPEGTPRTYYGLQPGLVEIALRWPCKDEARLLALDPRDHTWVMVALANLSGVKLDLGLLRAEVFRDGRPATDAGGRPVRSIPSTDPDLIRQVGDASRELRPGAVNPGETTTFPMVFPVFKEWTEIQFIDETNKIDVAVRNYAEMAANVTRYLRARKLAAERRRDAQPAQTPSGGTGPKTESEEYALVGYIRNEISAGKYGIRLIAAELAKKHTRFYVRIRGQNLAELRSASPQRTIADAVDSDYKPRPGDGVYVRRADAKE